ncbi:hypothetical protein GGI04_003766 [Coemansia thaxteri]|nr:hypothetical protein GGI04_003766 [Coemansia thaxteri]KAJ2467384.1 hypothetical protein GGI02_004053 [Coemansia sp. RSA 2322]
MATRSATSDPLALPALQQPAEPSVAGCEPPAHTAQRLISQITGYRCTHLHPAIDPATGCAYVGPQMVEPLAMQIELRAAAPAAAVHPAEPLSDDSDDPAEPPRHTATLSSVSSFQHVITCYYMAWLTQSRFEQRAATLPVGPAGAPAPATPNAQPTMPLAEVTWFKMDTAVQVLSHESDKLALREAIHRLTRLPAPTTRSAALATPSAAPLCINKDKGAEAPVEDEEARATRLAVAALHMAEVSPLEEAPSLSSVGFSDAATKTGTTSANTPARVVSPPGVRNLDLLRKTATSLSKRGGLLIRRPTEATAPSPPNAVSMPLVAANNSAQQATAQRSASAPQDLVARRKPHIPRVLSLFYKLVGSSST